MSTGKPIEVTRLDDGRVQVVKGIWSEIFDEERRLPWADWYEQMQRDHGYEGYGEMARLLRALN